MILLDHDNLTINFVTIWASFCLGNYSSLLYFKIFPSEKYRK